MNDKLNTLYIEVFRVKEIKSVIVLLELSNIKIYSRFHVFLLKKASLNILKAKN